MNESWLPEDLSPYPRDTTWEDTAEATRLYHYTSIAGLQGILASASLRATHYAYMSDYSEVRYGLDLIRNHVENVTYPSAVEAGMDPHTSAIRRAIIAWLSTRFSLVDSNQFVCCFS